MDLETAQTTTTKLPILKQGEYDMWRLRIEQYFQIQDYTLWDIIENGNSFKAEAKITEAEGTTTTVIPGPVSAEEKLQKRNDVKVRSMLLMTLPNEHLLTFNQYKDAQTMFAAIQTRFGGNEATKKTQKTLLKQIQLDILGENISQEDLNLKFLRSLPTEWNTHVVVWRNKPDLDKMSFDDLYNNFKIVEQEVKRTTTLSSSLSSQNMAFVSSPGSTNEVNTTYGVSTASPRVNTASTQVSTTNLSDAIVYAFLANQPNGSHLVHKDLEQIHEDELEEMDLKWQLALLSLRARRFFKKTGKKITINPNDIVGYDKSKVKCFNYHKIGHFARECRGPRNHDSRNRNQENSRRTVKVEDTSSKAMLAIDRQCDDLRTEINKSKSDLANYKRGLASVEERLDFFKKNEIPENSKKGLGYESYNVVPPPPTGLFAPPKIDFSNSGLEEFKEPKFEGYRPKASKNVSTDAPIIEDWKSDSDEEDQPKPKVVKKIVESKTVKQDVVSDGKLKKKTVFPTAANIEVIKPKQQEKPVRKPVKYAEMYKS
ncbi:putative ribonuclease H-like domain-containing protein [Tanacetum coccineum]